MSNKKWIVANNGLDIHRADESFYEIATAFNKKDAQLIAVAPEMLSELWEIRQLMRNLTDRGLDFKVNIEVIDDLLKKARGEK